MHLNKIAFLHRRHVESASECAVGMMLCNRATWHINAVVMRRPHGAAGVHRDARKRRLRTSWQKPTSCPTATWRRRIERLLVDCCENRGVALTNAQSHMARTTKVLGDDEFLAEHKFPGAQELLNMFHWFDQYTYYGKYAPREQTLRAYPELKTFRQWLKKSGWTGERVDEQKEQQQQEKRASVAERG